MQIFPSETSELNLDCGSHLVCRSVSIFNSFLHFFFPPRSRLASLRLPAQSRRDNDRVKQWLPLNYATQTHTHRGKTMHARRYGALSPLLFLAWTERKRMQAHTYTLRGVLVLLWNRWCPFSRKERIFCHLSVSNVAVSSSELPPSPPPAPFFLY